VNLGDGILRGYGVCSARGWHRCVRVCVCVCVCAIDFENMSTSF
jgi:hypothetical protein